MSVPSRGLQTQTSVLAADHECANSHTGQGLSLREPGAVAVSGTNQLAGDTEANVFTPFTG